MEFQIECNQNYLLIRYIIQLYKRRSYTFALVNFTGYVLSYKCHMFDLLTLQSNSYKKDSNALPGN
jgi:hypothetical protein